MNNLVLWKCMNCNKINLSNRKEHHQLDMCSCEQSGLDAETYQTRIIGQAKILYELSEDTCVHA